MNIFCSHFGGCLAKEKLIFSSISVVLQLQKSFMWQYMAGAGAELKLWTKSEPKQKLWTKSEPKIATFSSATLRKTIIKISFV